MKKTLLFLIFSSLIFGCDSKKIGVEIIPNYNLVYENATELNQSPKIVKGAEFLNSQDFKTKVDKIRKENAQIPAIIKCNLYINESGSIEKIQPVNTVNNSKLNELLAEQLSNVHFSEVKKDNNNIKAQFYWEFDLEHFSEISDSLKNQGYKESDEPPALIDKINLKYPENARKNGIQGKVYLKVWIDQNGTVTKTEVIKGVNDELNKAAQDALQNVKFKPAKVKGKPVSTNIVLPISFKLE